MGLAITFPNGTTTIAMAGLYLSPGCNATTTNVPTCTASGLANTGHSHTFGTGSVISDAYWLGFNASCFNPAPSSTSLFSGVATNINLYCPSGAGTIYGQYTSRNLNSVGTTYQKYFTIPLMGIHSIVLDFSDDVAYIWTGGAVQAGNWGETNWDIHDTYNIRNPRATGRQSLVN